MGLTKAGVGGGALGAGLEPKLDLQINIFYCFLWQLFVQWVS